MEASAALDALGGLGGLPPEGLDGGGAEGVTERAGAGDSPAGPLLKGDLEKGDLLSVDSFDDIAAPPAKCYQLIITHFKTARHHQKTILLLSFPAQCDLPSYSNRLVLLLVY